MKSGLLHPVNGRRTFVLIMDKGETVLDPIREFASRKNINAARISAIGAFSDVELMYFDWNSKDYARIPVDEQVEVASLNGDIAGGPDGSPAVHIHLVVARRDGTALAGHLGEAHVRPTLEVFVEELRAYLQKVRHERGWL